VAGQTLVVETQQVQDDMFALLRWADHHGLRLPDLAAEPASLQEIFLAIGKGSR
jgi:ABC-2 type transport system ATP-binding protein